MCHCGVVTQNLGVYGHFFGSVVGRYPVDGVLIGRLHHNTGMINKGMSNVFYLEREGWVGREREGGRERERTQNSELYYTRFENLGNCLFLQSVLSLLLCMPIHNYKTTVTLTTIIMTMTIIMTTMTMMINQTLVCDA